MSKTTLYKKRLLQTIVLRNLDTQMETNKIIPLTQAPHKNSSKYAKDFEHENFENNREKHIGKALQDTGSRIIFKRTPVLQEMTSRGYKKVKTICITKKTFRIWERQHTEKGK